jgi:hypothetical protein
VLSAQGPTFSDVQLLANSRKFSHALTACDEYLRGAADKAATQRKSKVRIATRMRTHARTEWGGSSACRVRKIRGSS